MKSRGKRYKGFTLVEILVVIAIIAVLLTAVMGLSGGFSVSRTITTSAGNLKSELSLARNMAIAAGKPVEVRVYQKAQTDRSRMGTAFTIYQRFVTAADGADGKYRMVPDGRPTKFTSGAFVNSDPKYSTLASPNRLMTQPPDALKGALEGTYFSIRFLPDGSAALGKTPPAPWSITIQAWNAKMGTLGNDNHPSLTPNYATLVVDPFTGRTKSYRPGE